MSIIKLLDSGGVVRYHNVPGMDKQTNAEHQWGVATMIQRMDPECRKVLILAGMHHDVGEAVTGDVPFTAKKASSILKTELDIIESNHKKYLGVDWEECLLPSEMVMLKDADQLEGMWYCITQMRKGCKAANAPFRLYKEAIIDRYGFKEMPNHVRVIMDNLTEEYFKWD